MTKFKITLFIFLFSVISQAQQGYTRSYRMGLSWNHRSSEALAGSRLEGVGLSSAYEFNLNPRFTLGINLDYRSFAGEQGLTQLGYGLLMKHQWNLNIEGSREIRPYLEYGLLMNVSRQKGRPRSGTSHDTKLGLGLNFNLADLPLFIETSYHISRLSYFEQNALNLDYLQMTLGWRGSF